MKKHVIILILFALCFSLFGCKKQAPSGPAAGNDAVVIRLVNNCSVSPLNIAVRYRADGTVLGTMGLNSHGGELKTGERYLLTLRSDDLPETVSLLTLEVFVQTKSNSDYISCGSGTITAPAAGSTYEITLNGGAAEGFSLTSDRVHIEADLPNTGPEAETPVSPDAEISKPEIPSGPYHLAETADPEALSAVFPGAAEFGSGLEISSKGMISWYVGADGASGTCSMEGSVLHAEVIPEGETNTVSLELTVHEDGTLDMLFRDTLLSWVPGEGETLKGTD